MTPNKMLLSMLAMTVVTVGTIVILLWWLASPDKVREAEENIARQYAISLDSVVRYYKGKDSITHAVTEGNYVTPAQLEMINKQLFEEIKTVVGGNMKNFVSNLKVTVEYPERKDSGITHFDSLTRRITLKPVDDSCITINSFVDSLKIGHTTYKIKTATFNYTTYWKKSKRPWKSDTLLVDGSIKGGCGEITAQKSVTAKPEVRRPLQKPATLLAIGAAVGAVLVKILLP